MLSFHLIQAMLLAAQPTPGPTAAQQAPAEGAAMFMAPAGNVFGQAVGVTAITMGSDPAAQSQLVLFSGLLEITKSHAELLPSGRHRINAQIDSSLGNNEALAARSARMAGIGFVQIWVDPDPTRRSIGFLTEMPPGHAPGHDQPGADGHFELYLVFQMGPEIGQVRNREPVVLSAHIHQIPPITRPIRLARNMTPAELERAMAEVGDTNSWNGTNLPVALYDREGVIRAWFTPRLHKTVLTGVCGDAVDNDMDGTNNEESPDNIDNDNDGFVDEDSTCPN
jgi:hypothetical protein